MKETFEGAQGEMDTQVEEPAILIVTDLGGNNKGAISAADIAPDRKQQLVEDAGKPEYRKRCSLRRVRCVDGRLPAEGLQCEEEEAVYAQSAGGEAVLHPMIDYMLETGTTEVLSKKTARHTLRVRAHGRDVVVHGDMHKGKGGCGANARKDETLRANALNIDVVAPRAWLFAQALELDRAGLVKEDITQLILTGKENMDNAALIDITPEELVDVAVANGAIYEELVDEHREKLIVADVSEHGFDEPKFMEDHLDENGKPLEAFVTTLGALKTIIFEDASREGLTERDAALRMAGAILFNIGVPKELVAEEKGNGETIPVVILGNK